jgi:thiol-disulfide isomerase/thioredoxin
MALALLFARLLLAIVFLIAGLAKFADRSGSQKALREFGVPEVLVRPMGIVLPIAEVALAVALVCRAWAWWAALGVLGLLLVFIADISYNLAHGRRFHCHCFGRLYSAPMGPSALARNTFLALLAALVIWFGRGSTCLSATSWFMAWSLAQRVTLIAAVIAVALMAGEGWLLLHTLRQQGRLLLRIERVESHLTQEGMVVEMSEQTQPLIGLPVGTKAPAFSGRSLDDETISLDILRTIGKPIILVFVNPTCAPCSVFLPEVGRWQRDYADQLIMSLISRGSIEDNRAKAFKHHITRLVLQRDNEIDRLYGVDRTPSAVLIDLEGFIDSPLAVGAEPIRALVARAASLPVLQPSVADRSAWPHP